MIGLKKTLEGIFGVAVLAALNVATVVSVEGSGDATTMKAHAYLEDATIRTENGVLVCCCVRMFSQLTYMESHILYFFPFLLANMDIEYRQRRHARNRELIIGGTVLEKDVWQESRRYLVRVPGCGATRISRRAVLSAARESEKKEIRIVVFGSLYLSFYCVSFCPLLFTSHKIVLLRMVNSSLTKELFVLIFMTDLSLMMLSKLICARVKM